MINIQDDICIIIRVISMEKRINSTVEEYTLSFKNDICQKLVSVLGDTIECTEIVNYICNYDRLVLGTQDFAKRKRVKNEVPFSDRCIAKRSCGEQCTRRKKDNEVFCGTHVKGTPHGSIEQDNNQEKMQTSKVEVWLQDFKGISYYIDKGFNVYQTEDIVSNKRNPKVIAKYTLTNGVYAIDFGS